MANIKKRQNEDKKQAFLKKFKTWTVVYRVASILSCVIVALASSVGTAFSIIVIPTQIKWIPAVLCGIITFAAMVGAIYKGWSNKFIDALIIKKKAKLLRIFNLTEDDLM